MFPNIALFNWTFLVFRTDAIIIPRCLLIRHANYKRTVIRYHAVKTAPVNSHETTRQSHEFLQIAACEIIHRNWLKLRANTGDFNFVGKNRLFLKYFFLIRRDAPTVIWQTSRCHVQQSPVGTTSSTKKPREESWVLNRNTPIDPIIWHF